MTMDKWYRLLEIGSGKFTKLCLLGSDQSFPLCIGIGCVALNEQELLLLVLHLEKVYKGQQ